MPITKAQMLALSFLNCSHVMASDSENPNLAETIQINIQEPQRYDKFVYEETISKSQLEHLVNLYNRCQRLPQIFTAPDIGDNTSSCSSSCDAQCAPYATGAFGLLMLGVSEYLVVSDILHGLSGVALGLRCFAYVCLGLAGIAFTCFNKAPANKIVDVNDYLKRINSFSKELVVDRVDNNLYVIKIFSQKLVEELKKIQEELCLRLGPSAQ